MTINPIQKLREMKMEHPGGFGDVFDWLEKNAPTAMREIERRCREYCQTAAPIGGVLAGIAFRVLREWGLPNPGDKKWAQACSRWPEPKEPVGSYKSPQPQKTDALPDEPIPGEMRYPAFNPPALSFHTDDAPF